MIVNEVITGITIIIIGYLLGSVPSAYIVTRLRKSADIRQLGGGNVGATNVMHQVGIWEGAIVLAADVGKGSAAILLSEALGASQPWLLSAGFSVMLGHCFPIYIGFRGGRGVATAVGVFLALSPIATGIACGIIGAMLLLSRNIFLSVVVCTPFFLLTLWLVNKSPALMVLASAIIIFMGLKSQHGLKEIMVNTARRFRP
ncbi:glycerol-3-phosphate acyltransferase [Chloroflexota bacterium]